MKTRFEERGKILDIVIAAISAMLSVGTVVYGIFIFGLEDAFARLGLILDIIYVGCVTMIWMYFFNIYLSTKQFYYWCSVCIGIAVFLRDILFLADMANYPVRLSILILSVVLLCMLTYFYARRDWESYTKRDLWVLCAIDFLIAALYQLEIFLEPTNEYTDFFLVEIWIRPTITYGLVACYMMGDEKKTSKPAVKN